MRERRMARSSSGRRGAFMGFTIYDLRFTIYDLEIRLASGSRGFTV